MEIKTKIKYLIICGYHIFYLIKLWEQQIIAYLILDLISIGNTPYVFVFEFLSKLFDFLFTSLNDGTDNLMIGHYP